jgi:hypothetical protein
VSVISNIITGVTAQNSSIKRKGREFGIGMEIRDGRSGWHRRVKGKRIDGPPYQEKYINALLFNTF